ncbi:hypothetical protein CYLTODRAFT_494564 [Cylindrobasidium torrendii FP15055 ss-10]|uniref:ER transporter 6TM N-terminal domain-containing protein n=1 Tax=Cylindrobasidium torrendii FP15055 ss-10 TaxID=1314674 RepID=A0A0D7AXE7_9AGAR|nr:hypothetical protein CYLTODRAFT_494564 [Cylindrobasidium torrendii FP15055 ss-10]
MQQETPSQGQPQDAAAAKSNEEKATFSLPKSLQWIPANWTWPKIRTAIRCALAAWLSAILFVIPAVERHMGQASYIILITAFHSPPSDPFIAVLEREVIICSIVAATSAWCLLGIFLANLTRTHIDYTITLAQAVTGRYIEARPTLVLAAFVFVWSLALLYIRARKGPGPYFMGTLLSCICLDITITTAVFFPFPHYALCKNILIPLGLHSCIALLVSLFVFPQTISAHFTSRLQGVLGPLIKHVELHRMLKGISVNSEGFAHRVEDIRKSTAAAETAIVPLAVASRLLPSDLIYSRFSPMDFKAFPDIVHRMAVRANGMDAYFSLIRTTSKSILEPASTHPGAHDNAEAELQEDMPSTSTASTTTSTLRPRSHQASRVFNLSSRKSRRLVMLTRSKSRPSRAARKTEGTVGMYDDRHYTSHENTISGDSTDGYTQEATHLLLVGCDTLLELNQQALQTALDWLSTARKGRFAFWRSTKQKNDDWRATLDRLKRLRARLEVEIAEFRKTSRMSVVDPYKEALAAGSQKGSDQPSHRHLFHCYVYQYQLLRFSNQSARMLDMIISMEQGRSAPRIWTPVKRLFVWNSRNLLDTDNVDDENPDTVEGLEPNDMEVLGTAKRRDPDALPPTNQFEWVMSKAYSFLKSFGSGDALFALKAAILTILMCLPAFLKETAPFAYRNRSEWAIAMSQLTLARFRGDTTFGFTSRVLSTIGGGLIGTCIWYISSPTDEGNPYGLVAVLAVCFPFFFYFRLYAPVASVTNTVLFLTIMMVVGYSYQDRVLALPGSPGRGITVAWHRLVLVICGVTAAFLFSFLPPAMTIRSYQRRLLATTSSELGAAYCSIISLASTPSEKRSKEVIASLIAVRSKLNRSAVLKQNTLYEFSLRGKWPAKRYAKIMDLQLALSYSLSYLLSVFEQMDKAWTQSLLARTRFLDPSFQGDVLAVISMITTALRTGEPLPQITPCPLVNRFYSQSSGDMDEENDFRLPKRVTTETLQDEQYLMFSVGMSTAFDIIRGVDELMVAAKEIVGEQYPISGLHKRMAAVKVSAWRTGDNV